MKANTKHHLTRRQFYLITLIFCFVFQCINALAEPENLVLKPRLSTEASRTEFDSFLTDLSTTPPSTKPALELAFQDLWDWTLVNGDSTDRLWLQIRKAMLLNGLGKTRDAFPLLRAVIISSVATEKQKFMATIHSRDLYFNLDAFDKALELHNQLNWEFADDNFQRLIPDNFLALIHYKIVDYNKAIEIYRANIKVMQEFDYPYQEMNITNNLGLAYEKKGQLDSAWNCFDRANFLLQTKVEPLNSYKPSVIAFMQGLFGGNKAQVLAAQGKHQEAIPLYKMDIQTSLNNDPNPLWIENGVISLIKLSVSYIALNMMDEAEVTLNQAEGYLQDIEQAEILESYYRARANFYKATGQEDRALNSLEQFITLRDSVQTHQRIIKSKNMLIAYNAIMQERMQSAQLEELEKLEQKAKRQVETNIFFTIVLILAVIITGSAVYTSKVRGNQQRAIAAKNTEIQLQKETIETSLKEKETLLREVNHRVKNNLQIISGLLFLQSRNVHDPIAKTLLQESQKRVQTMSIIHQKLYQETSFNDVNFASYLSDLAQQIIAGYSIGELKVKSEINIQITKISVDHAVPVSMIVHELITNSLKHAFSENLEGTIYISLTKGNNTAQLTYSDSGKGIQQKEADDDNNHIGMKVIHLLVQQLNGKLKINYNNPFSVTLNFELD